MIIPGDEIVSKEAIGKLGNKTLWQIKSVGGLYLIEARSSGGKGEIIGAGSHRAVARLTAKRKYPEVEFTFLEKSSEIDPQDVADILPFWEQVVDEANKRLK
jgi:hypothetical protein